MGPGSQFEGGSPSLRISFEVIPRSEDAPPSKVWRAGQFPACRRQPTLSQLSRVAVIAAVTAKGSSNMRWW